MAQKRRMYFPSSYAEEPERYKQSPIPAHENKIALKVIKTKSKSKLLKNIVLV